MEAKVQETEPLAFGLKRVAKMLDCSHGHVRNEIARGNLRATHLGRRVLITKRELERYLAGAE